MRVLLLCICALSLYLPCFLQAEETTIVIDENIKYKEGKGTQTLNIYCSKFSPGFKTVTVSKNVDLAFLAKEVCKKELDEVIILDADSDKQTQLNEGGENHE